MIDLKMSKWTFTYFDSLLLEKYYPWWRSFLEERFNKIQEYINEKWINRKISCKEKFWRFDITASWGTDNYLMYIITEVEETTPHICVDCWKNLKRCYWWDNRRSLWRVLPRCNRCYKNEKEERKKKLEQRRSESSIELESENKSNE